MTSAWFTNELPLIIGHRGASADAPENTLKAFRLAQTQGAHGIEFDVHVAADGTPVVIHDATLDRTTNGRGQVADHTVGQLQRLDAGDGEPVPTLDQVFETLGRDFLYNVEIKTYGWRDRGAERAIAACVSSHLMAGQVLISSFDVNVLRRCRGVFSAEIPLALLHGSPSLTLTQRLFRGAADHPYHKLVTARYMARMQAAGRRVHAWTVNDIVDGHRLAHLGVHGIITNHPAAMLAALYP